MKLAHIFQAREAWQHLTGLKIPTHTAYRLFKYVKLLGAENEFIEEKRIKLLREISGAKDGEPIDLRSNPEQLARFGQAFEEVLSGDCDMKPFDMTLPGLLDLLGKEQENVLSVADLGQLEPFFKEAS